VIPPGFSKVIGIIVYVKWPPSCYFPLKSVCCHFTLQLGFVPISNDSPSGIVLKDLLRKDFGYKSENQDGYNSIRKKSMVLLSGFHKSFSVSKFWEFYNVAEIPGIFSDYFWSCLQFAVCSEEMWLHDSDKKARPIWDTPFCWRFFSVG
jgi:hypothetical protein